MNIKEREAESYLTWEAAAADSLPLTDEFISCCWLIMCRLFLWLISSAPEELNKAKQRRLEQRFFLIICLNCQTPF